VIPTRPEEPNLETAKPMTSLERVFRLGSVTLADPDPSLPPEEAVRFYEANFPIIASSTLGEPFVEGKQMVIPIVKPDVKTKG